MHKVSEKGSRREKGANQLAECKAAMLLPAFDASRAHQLALYRSEGVMAALQQSALDTPSAREAPEADVRLPPPDLFWIALSICRKNG
jgi:hypothetical protein